MLAIGKYTDSYRRHIETEERGYQYIFTAWPEEVDATAFDPESRCIYETQEEALQDMAETSAYIRDNPTDQNAADMIDFLAALSNAVFLMKRAYPA